RSARSLWQDSCSSSLRGSESNGLARAAPDPSPAGGEGRMARLDGLGTSIHASPSPRPAPRGRARMTLLFNKVEPVEVHHFGKRRGEVTHERLLRVGAGIVFGDRPQLRVRTEEQIDGGAGPLDGACLAVVTLVDVLMLLLPLRAHVEQVHEEVVGERL